MQRRVCQELYPCVILMSVQSLLTRFLSVAVSAIAACSVSAHPIPQVAMRQTHLEGALEVLHFEAAGLPVLEARESFVRDSRGRVLRSRSESPKNTTIPPHPHPTQSRIMDWAAALGLQMEGRLREAYLSTDSGLLPVVRVETPWRRDQWPMGIVLDARTGVVLRTEPLLETEGPLANVFPENPATTPQTALEELTHLDEDSPILYGTYARVTTCVDREECRETKPLAQRTSGEDDFLYAPVLKPFSYDDPFAEVNAYRNLTAINLFLRERFGWQGLFFGQTYIEARVGKGDWYNAAYYRGNDERPPRIFFGQESIDFAYDADTAAHEFGHAFNDTVWDHPFVRRDEFGLDLAPNGIEEALADFWAIALAEDPILDAYVLRARHADNDVTCPDGEMAEGHMSARFIDGALWAASQRIGLEALTHVLYRSLPLLPLTPTLREFIDTLASSADELLSEGSVALPVDAANILRQEADKRGLLSGACARRIVPLSYGFANTRTAFGYGRKTFGGRDTPFGLQWQITAAADHPAFKLFLEWTYPDEVDPGFAVMIRRGEPVQIEWVPDDELTEDGPAYRATADLVLEGSPTEIDFPTSDAPPLSAGEIVYIQLATRVDENIVAIRVTLEPTDAQAPFPTFEPPSSPAPPQLLEAQAFSGCIATSVPARFSPLSLLFATGL